MYFDTAFKMQSLVYFVVIFLASLFAFFAMFAMVLIHSVGGAVVIGGCGMFVCCGFVYCLGWGVLARVDRVVQCIWFFLLGGRC